MPPRIISLDIETYGAACGLPSQTCFTPSRSSYIDGVPPAHQILTLSLTLPKEDPRCWSADPLTPIGVPSVEGNEHPTSLVSTAQWNAKKLSQLQPGPTMVFLLNPHLLQSLSRKPDPLLPLPSPILQTLQTSFDLPPRLAESYIYRWLLHADTILGMNLQFDLSFMRSFSPLWRSALSSRSHTLIDLSYVNFLESETRPERSLKNLGPVLGTHKYGEGNTLSSRRHTHLPSLLHYNAEDTHNTLLAISELSRRIDALNSEAKLSPFCIQFYTDTINCCIDMTANGVPFNRTALETYANSLLTLTESCTTSASANSLQLSGEGSKKSKDDFMQTLITAVNSLHFTPFPLPSALELGFPSHSTSALDHPLLQFTEKRRELSFSDANRTLLASFLPRSHPLQPLLKTISTHSHAQKLLSSYCYPYLWHQRKNPNIRTSLLVPQPGVPPCSVPKKGTLNPDIYLSHPSWFIVPSSVKDGSGNSGGTLQSRIVCKNGAHQTDPPEIQEFWQSRWIGGSIVSIDLSQIELRVAALLSGEPFFVNAFVNGHDLHGRGALMLWGERAILSRYPDLHTVPVDKWKSSPGFKQFERQVGKQINFAHLFRAGADKMQSTVLDVIGEILPLSLFHRVVSARQSELPLLWEWQEARIHEARTTGRIILPFIGQSRTFLGGDKYDVNEIVNFPVQTTASNIILRVAARLRILLGKLRSRTILPFLNVYDALKFDCKTSSDVEVLRILWAEALDYVVTQEYYHWLQNLYSRQIPIEYEIEVHTQE